MIEPADTLLEQALGDDPIFAALMILKDFECRADTADADSLAAHAQLSNIRRTWKAGIAARGTWLGSAACVPRSSFPANGIISVAGPSQTAAEIVLGPSGAGGDLPVSPSRQARREAPASIRFAKRLSLRLLDVVAWLGGSSARLLIPSLDAAIAAQSVSVSEGLGTPFSKPVAG